MKSVRDRINEFVKYHINGDGECNNTVLKAWAEEHGLSLQERYELSFFFSVTYCVESAVVMFLDRKSMLEDIPGWIAKNKQKLIFQSDRKYIRMKDSFERVLRFFLRISSAEDFENRVSVAGIISLKKAIPYVSSWELFGRFSAFLFLETFVELTGKPIENASIEWKKGNTATSGLLDIFGYDQMADGFDKTGRLSFPEGKMDEMLSVVLREISRSGGDPNVTKVETSLCAYRKFYKGSRYNGFYLDRMLGEIRAMQHDFPGISQELLSIRGRHFPAKYLGEKGGWDGIRTEMKKLYRESGLIT